MDEERDIMTTEQENEFNRIMLKVGTLEIKKAGFGLWQPSNLNILGAMTLRELKSKARDKGFRELVYNEGIQHPKERIVKL